MDEAYTMLGRLWADLQDVERCLARECLGLVSVWSQSEAATQMAWSRAEGAIAKSKKEPTKAKAAQDAALVEVESARKRYGEAEANLKAFQDEQAALTQ